ncbi:glutamine-hydrolyzing GMP synthase [bacterium]|nr:glutamine-hydrolyzing GMP synthase [bacterium]|tara:strand:+ start:7608 stop:9140 length:1533 start_codon:yes stop_codon:yes gene_type:complete
MIAVLDFGSQYTELIARRLREHGVLAKLFPITVAYQTLVDESVKGIILSGGPHSVTDKDSLTCDSRILNADIPILGICYGLQLMIHHHGGSVTAGHSREYGESQLLHQPHELFNDIPTETTAWMSHGDSVQTIPPNFESIGRTTTCEFAAIAHEKKAWYGLQFHPEVVHTTHGSQLLKNFAIDVCQCPANWTPDTCVQTSIQSIKETVGDEHVLCALSGGVDSAVAAVLIHKAIGNQLTCMFIDHGFMRKNEAKMVQKLFKELTIKIHYINASDVFLKALGDTTDPEKKRKVIGETFIRVFESESKKLPTKHVFLAQGTLYSDVIESAPKSASKTAHTIKSHHNVSGLPKNFDFQLLEPLRKLFKDEVRRIGKHMGMPDTMINRQPFPGPGLAIRIINQVITPDKILCLQNADAIVLEEVKKAGLYDKLWQSFAILTPIKTVGVQGDQRTYQHVLALRFVNSEDAMTAHWANVPHALLKTISTRICNELSAINRVVYDISSKPPATIEWE